MSGMDRSIRSVRAQIFKKPAPAAQQASGSVAWSDISGKPVIFTPTAHSHSEAEIVNLVGNLAAKAPLASPAFTGTPTSPTASPGANTTQISTTAFVPAALAALVASSPAALDTLNELAAALGNDQNFAATMTAALAGKASVSHTHPADRTGQSLFKPASGVFLSNGKNASALGTGAQTANRHILSPFIPAYDLTIDQVGVSVSTLLAGANCKVTIFDTDADGRPSTLLRESGNLSAAATGTVTGAITPLALTAGKLYWIGVRSSGTQTLRTLAVGATSVLSLTTAATPVSQGTLILTETFANAAANWSYASSQHSNTVMPLVLLRVA